jgi:O-antigen/teichoic acid export membrane protein
MPYSQIVKIGVLIAALSFIFPALNQIAIGLFQKRLSMDRSALAEIISRVALVIGIIIITRNNNGLTGILVVTVIAAAINFVFHYLFARKFAKIKLQIDFSLWKKILSKSWPLAITIVLNLIYLRADVLILSLYRNSTEVGLYGATYKVIDVLTSVPFMFAGLILPILTAAWLEKKTGYFKNVLQKSFDFMAIIAIPLIVGAQFLAEKIMVYIAGDEFIGSGIILKYLIISVAAIFLGTMFSHAVIALDKQKKLIGFYAFTSLSSLIAYFIFIPQFSYFGAAGVTIYSEILIGLFSAYCVYKYSRFVPNFYTLSKSLAAACLMGVFLYFFPEQYQTRLAGLIILIILASLIYFVSLYFLGGIDAQTLKSLFTKSNKGGPQIYDQNNNF